MPSPPSGPNHGRVAILGGAVVGGSVAARLAHAGHQGVLIDARPKNVLCIQARGLAAEAWRGADEAQRPGLHAPTHARIAPIIRPTDAGRLRIDPANLESIQAR